MPLYNDFPLNDNKSVLNSEPLVKAGDKVKKGDLIADTNFTRGGQLAIGTNLRVAYMPFMGYNFDDGVVISESAAEKLRSEHMLRDNIAADKNTILDKKQFFAQTAGQYTKDQSEKLDDAGVIKPGSIVTKGDILIGALQKEQWRPEHELLAKFNRKIIPTVRAQPTQARGHFHQLLPPNAVPVMEHAVGVGRKDEHLLIVYAHRIEARRVVAQLVELIRNGRNG